MKDTRVAILAFGFFSAAGMLGCNAEDAKNPGSSGKNPTGISGDGSTGSPSPSPSPSASASPSPNPTLHFYIAGDKGPGFWKDGVWTPAQPSSSSPAVTTLGVINGDVYTGGWFSQSFANYRPIYWVNGVAGSTLPLPSTGNSTQILTSAAQDGAVLFAGYNILSTNSNVTNAAYWLDGALRPLQPLDTYVGSKVMGATASGSSHYLVGYSMGFDTNGHFKPQTATLWGPNDAPLPMSCPGNPGITCAAIAVSVANGHVIAAGVGTHAYLWVDRVAYTLQMANPGTPPYGPSGSALAVLGNDVFVGGQDKDGYAGFWRVSNYLNIASNQPPTSVVWNPLHANPGGFVTSMVIVNGTVYAAGAHNTQNEAGYYTSGLDGSNPTWVPLADSPGSGLAGVTRVIKYQ